MKAERITGEAVWADFSKKAGQTACPRCPFGGIDRESSRPYGQMIADTENTIIRPTEGRFRCPFCTDDELVDADTEHEHDGLCGDREWTDELPSFPAHLSMPANELPSELLTEEMAARFNSLPDDVLIVDLLIEVGLTDRLEDDDAWWPTCPCCGRRGQLIVPLVELAA